MWTLLSALCLGIGLSQGFMLNKSQKWYLQKNDHLGTIPVLAKEWKLKFEINPRYYMNDTANCLNLTSDCNGSTKPGDNTILSISFNGQKGIIINLGRHGEKLIPLPKEREWTSVEAKVQKENGKNNFVFNVNNTRLFNKTIEDPISHHQVQVFAAGSVLDVQPGSMRNLIVSTKTEEVHDGCLQNCSSSSKFFLTI